MFTEICLQQCLQQGINSKSVFYNSQKNQSKRNYVTTEGSPNADDQHDVFGVNGFISTEYW